jgi:glycosyltransferase involved in cell wall biosynthesis
MKYITFVVPCYNSENYMRRCIDSLLIAKKYVEIIIINDGSTDQTGAIADHYVKQYPDTIRVIHQKNGGHGAGVNAGLAAAVGAYFKVVDSDDWLDEAALKKLLHHIHQLLKSPQPVDLVICNYIYDHLYEKKTKRMGYQNIFKEQQICTWADVGTFRPSQYLVMHALIYRTQILRQAGLKLPHHTFYVDNLFANQPLPYVQTLYYLNLDLYHYFLGREDQSVNETVLMKRIDQQILVTKLVAKAVDLNTLTQKQPQLAHYLTRNISIMMTISSIHLLLIGTTEAMKKREQLWHYIRKLDRKLYHNLKYKMLSGCTNLPGKIGDRLTLLGYQTARRIYHFN